MKTGIVVVNYNNANEVIEYVKHIKGYNLIDVIVVVDNGSTDNSYELLAQLKKIILLKSDDNKGYAAGNNIGIKYLYTQKCDNIIISNSDIIVDKLNLEKFINLINSNKEYHVFGPTIKEKGLLNRGWKQRDIKYDIHDNYPLVNRLFKKQIKYSDKHYLNSLSKVDCISGCFFGIKKDLIDKIGYLDEGTFLYYEEDILGAKLKEAGLLTCVSNEIIIEHNHSVTVDKNINHYRKLRILKNSQFYYESNYGQCSTHQLKRLKRTGNLACSIAYKRTNKKTVNVTKRKRKKITIFALHLKVGGIEKAICSLANMLIDSYIVEIVCVYKYGDSIPFYLDERVQVTYLSTNLKANKEELHFALKHKKIIMFLKESFKAIYVLYKKHSLIKQATKDNDANIIISSTLTFDKMLSKYQNNKLLIAWEHCHPDRSKNYVKQVQKAVKGFDLFIPSSKALLDYYKEIITGPQCTYLPLCIDNVPNAKSSLNSNQITVIGRLSKEKGYDDMLRVFKEVLIERPNTVLNILGDGECKEELCILSEKLGLKDKVNFKGNTVGKEKEKVLLNTSVFITTSHYESFGLVLLEAMSYGIPCVSFDSAKGSLEIIKDGENGYIIKNRDIKAMARKVVELLDNNNEQMSENAIETAKKYEYNSVKKIWLDYFEKMNIKELKTRVIFTSSAGGHFSELCELQELMDKYNSFIITEDHEMMKDLKKVNKARSWYMPAGTKEHLFKFLCNFPINIIRSYKVYRKVRPDVVIATGAHTTVPICYITHMHKKKVIFIETFANISSKTLSGKLVYPIADLFLVQWEEMLELYPNAKYRGGLK